MVYINLSRSSDKGLLLPDSAAGGGLSSLSYPPSGCSSTAAELSCGVLNGSGRGASSEVSSGTSESSRRKSHRSPFGVDAGSDVLVDSSVIVVASVATTLVFPLAFRSSRASFASFAATGSATA